MEPAQCSHGRAPRQGRLAAPASARRAEGALQTVTLNGIPSVYRVDGRADAPTLVLIGSLGNNLSMWIEQSLALSRSHRVVRYDIRGHGLSGVPTAPTTIEQLGDDLLGLLDHLGIPRAHLCGLALGGLIVQWVAIAHPERVDRLVLANTAARIGSAESWAARIDAVRAGGMPSVCSHVLEQFFAERFRARNPEVVAAFGAQLEATHPAGYMAACAALRDADLRPHVPSIQAPALVITGAHNRVTPSEQSVELHKAIAGSKLTMFPDAGHLANVEQPEAFAAELLRFLCR